MVFPVRRDLFRMTKPVQNLWEINSRFGCGHTMVTNPETLRTSIGDLLNIFLLWTGSEYVGSRFAFWECEDRRASRDRFGADELPPARHSWQSRCGGRHVPSLPRSPRLYRSVDGYTDGRKIHHNIPLYTALMQLLCDDLDTENANDASRTVRSIGHAASVVGSRSGLG